VQVTGIFRVYTLLGCCCFLNFCGFVDTVMAIAQVPNIRLYACFEVLVPSMNVT
jgi:hypothetical protein